MSAIVNTEPTPDPQTGTETRFKFGNNWSRFLQVLDEERIAQAERSLSEMLGLSSLAGKTFLDIGSGSGLFSLAARRLGARVHSFDYDAQSVACTAELRRRFFDGDADWKVEQGSALSKDYLSALGQFDIVYSWGVLHHTGQMWPALENAALPVKHGGLLFIAIYNDQGWKSTVWTAIKFLYNKLPFGLKYLISVPYFLGLYGCILIRDTVKGDPIRTWKIYRTRRGMSPWYDVVDWVGGYPFEVASVPMLTQFYTSRGFETIRIVDVAPRLGCNELVFRKDQQEA